MKKPQIQNLKSEAKGYVLISVLVIMMVMLVITYFLADALFSELAIARNQKAATVAFNLAEAGVQEAVWRIQYDDAPNGARDKFLNTINGVTQFNHDPALLSGGSYETTITNTAEAVATISSTGFYTFGLKTAQRRITVNVTKAATPPPYNYNGAIFTGGSVGDEDIRFTNNVTANITGGGSLISNRNIEIDWGSTVNVEQDAISKDLIIITHSSTLNTPNGQQVENAPDTYSMPSVDVTSANATSYKNQALNQDPPQYYTTQEFRDLFKNSNSVTLDGIVYVAGSVNIDHGELLTVNGMLVAEGSVDIGAPNNKGTLTVNHIEGQPSGVITLSKFTGWADSVINITGLLYVGDRFSFDPWYKSDSTTKTINITGGVHCRRFEVTGERILNIEFNVSLINEGLQTNPQDTPVIQFQHWEEEY